MTSRGSTATLGAEALAVPGHLRAPITAFRSTLLVLAAVLTTFASDRQYAALPIALLGGLALFADRARYARQRPLAVAVVEAVVTGASIVLTGGSESPMLPYLLAPPASVGLTVGARAVLAASGAAAVTLLAGRLVVGTRPAPVDDTDDRFVVVAVQWVLLGLALGLLATRARGRAPDPSADKNRYAEARELLEQLRAVSRGLPGSLDPGSVARTLLDECIELTLCEHGSVLLDVEGDQLVPLALHGYQRIPWRASLSSDGPIQRAWLSGSPMLDRRDPDTDGQRAGSVLLVLPMTVEAHRVAVVALESPRLDAFDGLVDPMHELVGRYALPLESAALFDELRMRAAQEERTRLAREMHDGIAQDLAFLGYELDALSAVLRHNPDKALDEVRRLRKQITGLMSDLRLSITDLRSSIGPSRGLGAALSEYARSVGTSSGMTVRLSLTEGSTRLPADTEVQMLRIAHEAMSRARRRPDTSNLWVTLVVDPPNATLEVEDDAVYLPEPGQDDTTGLKVMRERADKLGATFSATPRRPKGMRVSVSIGRTADESADLARR
ncbi:MAG: histidine kinase [Actinomycetota bacterium]|nr:histidine kinase [Actinomycetota bacterium]